MANISIFAKHAVRAKADKHMLRGSSQIRGEQVAAKIDAKLNPESGYEDDICIYVKPSTQDLYSGVIKLAKNAYIDVIDSEHEVQYAREHPEVGVIICSLVDYNRLANELRNKVVFIPQHHCNFERVKRSRNEITIVGVIGAPGLLVRLPDDLEGKMAQAGLKLVTCSDFFTRQSVINFYQGIDIQLVWRPWPMKLSNPLKIVNASSFGLPTIAYEEEVFSEVTGCYLPAKTTADIIDLALMLKDKPDLYAKYSDKCLDRSEEYHIDTMVDKYKKLEEV